MAQRLAGETTNSKFDTQRPEKEVTTTTIGDKNRLDTTSVIYDSSGNIINAATEDKQDDIIAELNKLIGFQIPEYDYLALTYVAAGNGAGEVETVIYKTGGVGGSTVATLTLAYNASNEVSSVTKT